MKQFFKFFFATILGFMVSIFLIMILLSGMMATFFNKTVKPKTNMVLELSLNYVIPEQTHKNPLIEFFDKIDNVPLGLDQILYNIKRAENDDNVSGILLRPGFMSAGFGTVSEIANALKEFRKSGKFVYAYCENLTEKSYLISVACDSIFLNPSGNIGVNGLSSNVMFYKGLLDKLGIEVELFKVGTHKGAAEIYTRNSLSPENRSQIQRYIDVIFDNFCNDIADGRGINKDEFKNDVVNFAVQSPEQALDKNWVDALWYEDQVADLIKERTGRKTNEKICFTNVSSYVKMEGPELRNIKSKNKIAYVYIDGEISNNNEKVGNKVSCKSLLHSLRKIRYSDKVKAVVIRVNSPGGSAYGSDQLWREIKLIREKKPVIISMGDVAASGGYYLAAPADSIVVNKYTITGSIGVFALYPNANKFLGDKLGLTFESVNTGKYSDLGMPGKDFTESERQIIQNNVNQVYKDFTSIVCAGRGIDTSEIDEIAQGKVWIAEDALNYGLVDVQGGIDDAIKIAAYKAGIEDDDYMIYYLPKNDDFMSQLLNMRAEFVKTKAQQQLGAFYPYFEAAQDINSKGGVQMLMPYTIEID